jgi:CHAD domain-containing protein
MTADVAPRLQTRAVPVTPGTGVTAVIRDALDASVQRLLVADPIARVGEDPEGVHQARVATRRLRSDLRTFAPLLDPAWVTSLRDELRWLGAELGGAREAEVLLGHLRERARALPSDIARQVSPVLDAAAGDRAAAYDRVLEVLRSSRYLDLVDRLVQGAMAPRMSPDAASATMDDLTGLARRPWKQLRRDYLALGSNPPDAALHAVRIRAKRARYAVEAVTRAIDGDQPRRFAVALTGLQDVLGDHQDAVVAEAWLRPRVAAGNPADAYAGGMLAGLLRADALAATAALPRAWHRASRRELRAWL